VMKQPTQFLIWTFLFHWIFNLDFFISLKRRWSPPQRKSNVLWIRNYFFSESDPGFSIAVGSGSSFGIYFGSVSGSRFASGMLLKNILDFIILQNLNCRLSKFCI
jgi:hypothetical protein